MSPETVSEETYTKYIHSKREQDNTSSDSNRHDLDKYRTVPVA